MGLTKDSVANRSHDSGLIITKQDPSDTLVALCGNPNVGKSSIFNELTGLNQHTGNWPGKTVTSASGYIKTDKGNILMVDLPGCYSLMSHSAEEEVARDFICFSQSDVTVVVCDATCLERNLNLVLQTAEITDNLIVCVNLMDQAKAKGIKVDAKALSAALGVPVVLTSAKNKSGLRELINSIFERKGSASGKIITHYPDAIEQEIYAISQKIESACSGKISTRWLALKMISGDKSAVSSAEQYLGVKLPEYTSTIENADDIIVSSLIHTAEGIATECVKTAPSKKQNTDRVIDKFLTNKITGFPVMLALLCLIFWITMKGANYPSQLLSSAFNAVEQWLYSFFESIGLNQTINDMLFHGVFRVLGWVVAVMLPPMAIFFPLFTLLEDLGYLPRVAFNLDRAFKKCSACGKQALTTCMGFGCNAAGIVGCRIIDSKRERLIAMITNSFIPCNGRFPTIIAIITMFLVFSDNKSSQGIISALILTGVIVFSIVMSMLASKVLSLTVLKGMPSSFTLELPPYRMPKIGKLIVRSIFDRTLFVLGRAIAVAAPAGLLIWLFANVNISGTSILGYCVNFLDPFASIFGLDGTILMAFILGFPANEIVIPIILMSYCATTGLSDYQSLDELKNILVNNGWTYLTAVNTIIFTLFHFPCSTALLTFKKESGSVKWTFLAFLCPLITGFILCFITKSIYSLVF